MTHRRPWGRSPRPWGRGPAPTPSRPGSPRSRAGSSPRPVVRLPVVRQRDDRDRQGPATAPGPLGVVGAHGRAEGAADLGGQHAPGADQVDSRVAHADRPEVDHGAQPSAGDQQVPGHQVAVRPQRRPGVRGGAQGLLPRGRHRRGVDPARQLRERLPHEGVPGRERHAPVAEGSRRGVLAAQGPDVRRQVLGEQTGFLKGPGHRIAPVEPAVHRPRPREVLPGLALPEGFGRGGGQPGRQPGQPAQFVRDGVDGAGMPGEPHDLVRAEAEHGVLRSGGLHAAQRQPRPPREPVRDQPADERGVDGDFVLMHSQRAHGAHSSGQPADCRMVLAISRAIRRIPGERTGQGFGVDVVGARQKCR